MCTGVTNLRIVRCGFALIGLLLSALPTLGETPWRAGFARVDITPKEPVRMAGYGSRDHASEGFDTPLYVRAMALQNGSNSPHVLVSVDTIGLPGSLTRDLAETLENEHALSRSQVVFCSTHTHCGPDLVSELSNIFTKELTDEEKIAGTNYREQLKRGIVDCIKASLENRTPVNLAWGQGTIGFAANRRVLKNGIWSGFGVQSDGPVDHAVPVLKIAEPSGKLKGVIFNYACHCTTLGGEHYKINAEWAGYACEQLESQYADAVALCTIGCGADANPNPRGTLDVTKLHGRAIAQEVHRLLETELKPIDQPIDSQFAYAGLSFDLPTIEEVEKRTEDSNAQTRRHAEQLRDIYRSEGRLPATYPVPIQSWKFGDALTMVFIGGEVVVDYALRLKRELNNSNLWVTAYANDVLGYIASEKMRQEKGYEYDRSGIFYGLPGPWASGSEDLLVQRIKELLEHGGLAKPLDPQAALKSFRLPQGYEIQLVASESLTSDPVNFAFGFEGELWVVEMGDYPQGLKSGIGGGAVKRLTDQDGDGFYETATTFLNELSFPTGVYPWRDGVIVSAAPEIFFARDRDGDGIADERETWYSGFPLANPQHRINGFTYGLDHSLHCASGDNLSEITSNRTQKTLNASGHDVQLFPESGEFRLVSGRTQCIRTRNDWGDWFGNDNSRPMWHFRFDDAYLSRNPAVKYGGIIQQMFQPPSAPPVFPASVTADRFNDLYAANRFTSACSATVFRSDQLGSEMQDAILVCEPVHNLIHRSQLKLQGTVYRAERFTSDKQSEFIASTDPWCRPVRVSTGIDGALYFADMYRSVIEHPQWIPQAWQKQLEIRAGSNRGRIYRVTHSSQKISPAQPRLNSLSNRELVIQLSSSIGPLRDLAQQLLIHRRAEEVVPELQEMAVVHSKPTARLHALWTLHGLKTLSNSVLVRELQDPHPALVRNAIQICESKFDSNPELLETAIQRANHKDAQVRLQLALSLGNSKDPSAGITLAKMALSADADQSLHQAIISSSSFHAATILSATLAELPNLPTNRTQSMVQLLGDLMLTAKALKIDVSSQIQAAIERASPDAPWTVPLTMAWATAYKPKPADAEKTQNVVFNKVYQQASHAAKQPDAPLPSRLLAIKLFGLGLGPANEEAQSLADLVQPTLPTELQIAAIEQLSSYKQADVLKGLFSRWPQLTQRVRDALISQCLAKPDWTEALLVEMEQQTIKGTELSAATRQQLRHTGSRSQRTRADRVLQETSATNLNRLVADYLESKVASGDRERGAAVFKKQCATCHTPDKEGKLIGPNLNNLTDRSAQTLAVAILDPNRAVEPQFRSYSVLLKDGRVFAGTIVEELGDSLQLARADGTRITIHRQEIEELRNTGLSLMPEGLQKDLDPQALQDIMAYIRADAPTLGITQD